MDYKDDDKEISAKALLSQQMKSLLKSQLRGKGLVRYEVLEAIDNVCSCLAEAVAYTGAADDNDVWGRMIEGAAMGMVPEGLAPPEDPEDKPQLLVLGPGGHGKDEVAKLLAEEYGLTFKDSSQHACNRAVYPVLRDIYHYSSPQECYDDRRNHRVEWRDLIRNYNNPKDRLVREILDEADVYVGLRCHLEFAAAQHHFDAIIWVDATARLKSEGKDPNDPSLSIPYQPASMLWLDNNGSLDDLKKRLRSIMSVVAKRRGPKAPN